MEDENIKDYFGVDNRYVIELQPSDFDSRASWVLLNRKGKPANGLVFFYAPWCGYCKRSKDAYLEAAKASGFCDYYAFNCEKHKNHRNKIQSDMPMLIQGFPTIISYENGQPGEVFTGERTKEGFLATCMEKCQGENCKAK